MLSFGRKSEYLSAVSGKIDIAFAILDDGPYPLSEPFKYPLFAYWITLPVHSDDVDMFEYQGSCKEFSLPLREKAALVYHQRTWCDRGGIDFLGLHHPFFVRTLAHSQKRVPVLFAVGDDRPAVILPLSDKVDLISAPWAVLDNPQPFGSPVIVDTLRVSMAVGVDLIQCLWVAYERIVFGDGTVQV